MKKKNKKILFVINALTSGGAEKSLISLLNMLNEDIQEEYKFQIDLLVASDGGLFYNQIPKHINLIDCPRDYKSYCSSFKNVLKNNQSGLKDIYRKVKWQMQKQMLKGKSDLSISELQWKYYGSLLEKLDKDYDVVLAYMNGTPTYYSIDKIIAKKKIVWVHNDFDKLNLNRDYQLEFFNKAHTIVTISERCAESLIRNFPTIKNKIKTIENISSVKMIDKLATEFYPDEYNSYIYEGCTIILSVGRIVYQKGYDIGLKAMKLLKEKNKDFRWFIIGIGELEDEIKRIINEYELNDYVILLGQRENPYPYIKNCDIFFQPSRYEGKSIALDEAKILNKPIVVTDYDTVYDSISNKENGIITSMYPKNIANEIYNMMINRNVMEKLSDKLKCTRTCNESEVNKYIDLIND